MSSKYSTPVKTTSSKTVAKSYIEETNKKSLDIMKFCKRSIQHARVLAPGHPETIALDEIFEKLSINTTEYEKALNLVTIKSVKKADASTRYLLDQEYIANFDWLVDTEKGKLWMDTENTYTIRMANNIAKYLFMHYYERQCEIEKSKFVSIETFDETIFGLTKAEVSSCQSFTINAFVFSQTLAGAKNTKVSSTIQSLIVDKLLIQ